MKHFRKEEIEDKNSSRSTSAPPKFSGSLFIQDEWSNFIQESEQDIKKKCRDDSVIKEELNDGNSRQASYLSNISQEIYKLLNSRNNSQMINNKLSIEERKEELYFENNLTNIVKFDLNSLLKNNSNIISNNINSFGVNLSKINNSLIDNEKMGFGPSFQGVNPNLNGQIIKKTEINEVLFNKLYSKMQNAEVKKNIKDADEFDREKAKHANDLSRDQLGCRMLQKWLEKNDNEINKIIFENIINDFDDLMSDPFGNYLCQKIMETCTEQQFSLIMDKISHTFYYISTNSHGTRSIQKLIESTKDEKNISKLIQLIMCNLMNLIKDNNGNHAIQKCLQIFHSQHKQFIFDFCIQHIIEISNHKHGCCVIQRCIDFGELNQKKILLSNLVNNTIPIIIDQYGNFVIQYILEMKDLHHYKKMIIEIISCNIYELTVQKFSSTIVEKSMKLRLFGFDEIVINFILNEKILPRLIIDKFANYVVQSAINICSEVQKELMIKIILMYSNFIKADTLGNKVYQKLAKSFPILNDDNLIMFQSASFNPQNKINNSNKK